MSTGVVRRLMKERGFGFIKSGEVADVFFHTSQLQSGTFDLLREGQSVRFRVGLGSKGLHALNVEPVNEVGCGNRQFAFAGKS